jgi:hypothetical protein
VTSEESRAPTAGPGRGSGAGRASGTVVCTRLARARWLRGALALPVALTGSLGALALGGATPAAAATTVTYTTPGGYTFIVPAGVTSILFDAYGAQGGTASATPASFTNRIGPVDRAGRAEGHNRPFS